MKDEIRIIGVDPSLRNMGIATGRLNIETFEWEVDLVQLHKTEKSKIKTVRKSSDDYDRCRILYEALSSAEKKADLAFVEMPIGSQSADAMKSYGACIMAIASLNIPVIQVTPTQVKVRAVNDKNATKEEMIQWAYSQFPNINWLRSGKRLIAANEHLADACAAINAGLSEDDFIAWAAMTRKLRASNTN